MAPTPHPAAASDPRAATPAGSRHPGLASPAGERPWYSLRHRPAHGYYHVPPHCQGGQFLRGCGQGQIPSSRILRHLTLATSPPSPRILVEYAVLNERPQHLFWSTVFDPRGRVLASCHWDLYFLTDGLRSDPDHQHGADPSSAALMRLAPTLLPTPDALKRPLVALSRIDVSPGAGYDTLPMAEALRRGYQALSRIVPTGPHHLLVTDAPEIHTTFAASPPPERPCLLVSEAAAIYRSYRDAIVPIVRRACPDVLASAVLQRELEHLPIHAPRSRP